MTKTQSANECTECLKLVQLKLNRYIYFFFYLFTVCCSSNPHGKWWKHIFPTSIFMKWKCYIAGEQKWTEKSQRTLGRNRALIECKRINSATLPQVDAFLNNHWNTHGSMRNRHLKRTHPSIHPSIHTCLNNKISSNLFFFCSLHFPSCFLLCFVLVVQGSILLCLCWITASYSLVNTNRV